MARLGAAHAEAAPAVEAEVLAVLRSGAYIGGAPVERLEAALAARGQRAHCVTVGSGTEALTLALMAQGIGPGDVVLVPAVTFFATAEAVLRTGAAVELVDVTPGFPLIDPQAVAEALHPRVKAIVPVHLFGEAAPALPFGLPLLDDAAQCAGATPARGEGIAQCWSFYPTKVLGAAGDGGAILTDDPAFARRVRALGYHGMTSPNIHHRVGPHIGGNARLDALQAAVLLGHLPQLDARIARRRAIAAAYCDAAPDHALAPSPGNPVPVFVLRHPQRDALARRLAEKGVATQVFYPSPLADQPALADQAHRPCPQARRFCAEALSLPCHPQLTDAEVEQVAAALAASL